MSMVMRRHCPWPLRLLDTTFDSIVLAAVTLTRSYQGRQQEGMVGKRKDQEYV
jgi:hypothetical protein